MSERSVLDFIMVFGVIVYFILTRKLSRNQNPYIGLILPMLSVLLACVFFILADFPLVSISRSDCSLYMIFCAALACIGYFLYGFEKIKEIQIQQMTKEFGSSVYEKPKL